MQIKSNVNSYTIPLYLSNINGIFLDFLFIFWRIPTYLIPKGYDHHILR